MSLTVIWRAPDAPPTATESARRCAETLLADGAETALPFATLTDAGRLLRIAPPSGAVDTFARCLSVPAFGPLRALCRRVDDWCVGTGRDRAELIGPDVLTTRNGALFGPLWSEAFGICAANRHPDVEGFVARRGRWYLDWLGDFLDRFARDRDRFTDHHGPILALSTHGNESHNHGRRVLRVDLDGGALAYKPRPARAEALILADGGDSLFGLLNGLPSEHGDVDLPQMSIYDGSGEDGTEYLWQRWLSVAPSRRLTDGSALLGTVLDEDEAAWFHKRAGALAAACVAFGVGDLGEGNLLVADDGDQRRYVPVDLEIVARPAPRLSDTGLVQSDATDTHHVGFENRARECGHEGAPAFLDVTGDRWTLRFVDRPWQRDHSAIVVADEDGDVGYGPYLDDVVSGAFGVWATLCRNRDTVTEAATRLLSNTPIRVLPRSTADYSDALARWTLLGEPLDPSFTDTELRQLHAGDVPYYVSDVDTGVIRYLSDDGWVRADVDRPADAPDADTLAGKHWDLTSLGPVLRDLIAFAATDGGDRPPVDSISLPWPRAGHVLHYTWDDAMIRLRPEAVEAFSFEDERAAIARRLCRLDDVDAVLRAEWVDSDFAPGETADRLRALTSEGLRWLETVVDLHGWPDAELVGPDASAAACRLVQHAEGQLARRLRMLAAMRAAVRMEAIPASELAYTEDALLIARGLPQRYGTKFAREGDRFVPHPVSDPDSVDERRREMGLESLARYAERIRRRFDKEDTSDPT
ncbi:DUF4135 domain-containing protein [Stackebrandtia soli]|uniref:DUF4135 domain-containing protein n=1 Tax=Stackebrandtia soli TaxID=1892856 RepID=UPI0039EBD378